MTTIITNEIEYKIPTNWDELRWDIYIDLMNLESKKETYIVPLLFTQRYIEVLAGAPDGAFEDVELNTLAELEPVLVKGFDQTALNNITQSTDHFIINGVTYSFYSPNTIGSITIGEQGYIEMMKQHNKQPFDHLLK